MKKVLVVEDSFEYGQNALAALKKAGFKAELATCAQEAIEKIQNNSYYFVISDMNMPINTGDPINPKAGDVVVRESVKNGLACFITTAGLNGHGNCKGDPVVDILFSYTLYLKVSLYGETVEKINYDWKERIAGYKNEENYTYATKVIVSEFTPLLKVMELIKN